MEQVVSLIAWASVTVMTIGVAVVSLAVAAVAFCWLRSLIKPATSEAALPASGRPTGHRGDSCL